MSLESNLEKYARLMARTGLNLQAGQAVLVNASLDAAPLARAFTKAAYEAGASDVIVFWSDEACDRIRYQQASEETLCAAPSWKADAINAYTEKGAAYLRISSADPDAFAGVDPARIGLAQRALSRATRKASDLRMANQRPWLVVSAPSPAWAQRVFPGKPAQEAVSLLWEAIFAATRVDTDDPEAAWAEHQAALARRVQWLNAARFDRIHIISGLGTDFTCGLPDGHLWAGGGCALPDGRVFVPNMPTEEVFSAPDKRRAEGTLAAALPLNHNGTLIEGIRLRFHEGQLVDYSATRGQEALDTIVSTDPGARRLGEIALIPCDSPIAKMGLLFYNTLFDENASCHFALGKAYSDCLRGGTTMTAEQLDAAGLNDSLTHEDFMVGTADTTVTGIGKDGSEKVLLKDGRWVI